MSTLELLQHTDTVNELLARYGVKFGIYKNNTFKEQLFLKDIYSKKQIVKDGVVPEDFIFASSGYMAECEGAMPPRGIYSHISGIDLVKGKDGT